MKNNRFFIIAILCLALSLCACGGSGQSGATSNSPTASKTTKSKKGKKKITTQTTGTTQSTTDGSDSDTIDAPVFVKSRKQTLSDEELDKLPQKKVEQKSEIKIAAKADIRHAIELAEEGNVEAAIRQLEKVIANDPSAFLAAYNLALMYERVGEYDKANATYRNCLAAEPTYSQALLNLVRLELREGKNALYTANNYIEKNPDIFEYQYAKLEALLGSGKDEEAIDIIRRLLKTDEASTRLRYYMALAEFHKKRYELSLYALQQALSITNEDPEIYFLLALVQLKFDNTIGAQEAIIKALNLRPDYLEALWVKGIIDYETRNTDEAEAIFRKMVMQNPTLPEAYLNLGNVLKTQRKGDEAEEYLKKAEALSPKSGDVKFALGALYLNIDPLPLKSISGMDRLNLAKRYFQDAQSLMTTKADKATAKDMINKTDKAIQILQAEQEAAELESAFSDESGDGGFESN